MDGERLLCLVSCVGKDRWDNFVYRIRGTRTREECEPFKEIGNKDDPSDLFMLKLHQTNAFTILRGSSVETGRA